MLYLIVLCLEVYENYSKRETCWSGVLTVNMTSVLVRDMFFLYNIDLESIFTGNIIKIFWTFYKWRRKVQKQGFI